MTDSNRSTRAGTLPKAAKVLEFFAAYGTDWSTREIARRLDMPHSSLHRVCQQLAAEDFLRFDPDTERYRWGYRLIGIARVVLQSVDPEEAILDSLHSLVAATGETALFASYDGSGPTVTFTHQVVGPNPVRYESPLGVPVPIHAGATGRAVLAFLQDDEIEEVLGEGMQPLTGATITDRGAMWDSVQDAREKGYVVSHGERIDGAVGHCAPVFGPDRRVLGSLCVTVPEFRHTSDVERDVLRELLRHAVELSITMGMNADGEPPAWSPKVAQVP